MRCNDSNWAVYSPGSWDGFRNDVWALWAGVIMRLEHHLVGGYVRYISPHIIIIIRRQCAHFVCVFSEMRTLQTLDTNSLILWHYQCSTLPFGHCNREGFINNEINLPVVFEHLECFPWISDGTAAELYFNIRVDKIQTITRMSLNVSNGVNVFFKVAGDELKFQWPPQNLTPNPNPSQFWVWNIGLQQHEFE